MHVPEAEEEALTPTLDDDGFESLDGNGSCDSNREEQDISLTAEEFETVSKSSPVQNETIDTGLVIGKRCPKFIQNDINLSISHRNNKNLDVSEEDVVRIEKRTSSDCVEVTLTEDAKSKLSLTDSSFEVNGPSSNTTGSNIVNGSNNSDVVGW